MLNESNKAGLIILISVLFGIYCFVFGQSGILERMHLAGIMETINRQINRLEAENDALFSTYLKYKSGRYLKHESEQAGYIADGETVALFPPLEETDSVSRDQTGSYSLLRLENEKSQAKQLRILWIILSFIIIFLYIVKNQSFSSRKEEED
ncbi:MAG: FtsB family cell division protein [Spirochaetota bacterium]